MSSNTLYCIRSNTIHDGTGNPPRPGTVVVRDGKITDILDKHETPPNDAEMLDVGDCALAPGFIDMHAHGDLEPRCAPNAESKLCNGVTTEVCGNCGSTPFPLVDGIPGYLREKAKRLGVTVDWQSTCEFFDRLTDAPCTINRLYLVGHGRLRGNVMRASAKPANNDERARMAAMLDTALAQGAWGLSSGLAYAPGCHADDAELRELLAVVAKYNTLYATHMESEGDGILNALDRTFALAQTSGTRIQVSHLKLSGESNWNRAADVRQRFDRAFADGIDAAADWYPYVAANANLDSLLPNWVYEGGTRRLLSRLRDPQMRYRLADHILELSRSEMTWDRVVVASVTLEEHRHFQGRHILEISEELSLPPEDVFFNLILAEGGRAEGFLFTMDEETQREIFTWPFVAVGSDATARATTGPTAEGMPHPRTYGCHARVLRLASNRNLLPMEEAIRRMTSLPASQIGLTDRGRIERGYIADLVVFDPATVRDRATYVRPAQLPDGILHVMVNGTWALKNGALTGNHPGKLLRRT